MPIYNIKHPVNSATYVGSQRSGQFVYCIGNGEFQETVNPRYAIQTLLPAEEVAQYVVDVLGFLGKGKLLIYFPSPKGYRANLGSLGQHVLISPHEGLWVDARKQSGMGSFDWWSLVAGCCDICIFNSRSEFVLSHVKVAGLSGLGILEIPTFGE